MSPAALAKNLIEVDPHGPLPDHITALLRARQARLFSDEPDLVPASEVKRLWSTRLQNARSRGATLQGAEELLQAVQRIPEDAELYQFSFLGEKVAGVVFFATEDGRYLGFALLDKQGLTEV